MSNLRTFPLPFPYPLLIFIPILLTLLLQTCNTSHLVLCKNSSPFPHLEDISSRYEALDFEEAYSVLWGDPAIAADGSSIQLKLDRHTGSGFISLDNYMYGLCSASIKFPSNHTAGIVLAFYLSNGGDYADNHDELDFEFLGNVKGKPWRMQTNIYGNGSVARGREERFNFWFDPTTDYHTYTILWNPKHIVFMVDNIPIREMVKSSELGGDYPSKPMALYATIWDGSQWATDGGKYPVDYKYAPFVATFKNLKLEGCEANPITSENQEFDMCNAKVETLGAINNPINAIDLFSLTTQQQVALRWVRSKHLYYTYCEDRSRYEVPLPECIAQAEATNSAMRRQKRRRVVHTTHPSRRG